LSLLFFIKGKATEHEVKQVTRYVIWAIALARYADWRSEISVRLCLTNSGV
jgi:hypothetical protein